jgi:ATP-dependent helicase/DNAse subunit B
VSAAVQDGQLLSVSASQINTFRECPRQWFWEKVLRYPKPEKVSQAEGTAIHLQMERFYTDGERPEHPSCQAALDLPEVPEFKDPVIIEEPRDYGLGLSLDEVPVRGRIDLFVPPDSDGLFRVLDWKSCKDYRFVKTPRNSPVIPRA